MRRLILQGLTPSQYYCCDRARGHAFGSWKSRGEPYMWLRDFLPESVPNARILTYGYDTKLPGSQSTASILELSKKLLESVKTIRSQQEVGLCKDNFTNAH
jgi:hypothetical protein